jgi:hypothetical protein
MTVLNRSTLGPGSRAPPCHRGPGAPRGQPLQASATPPPYPAEPRGHDPGQNSRDPCEPSMPSPVFRDGVTYARPGFCGRVSSPLASHTRGIGGDRWQQQAEA